MTQNRPPRHSHQEHKTGSIACSVGHVLVLSKKELKHQGSIPTSLHSHTSNPGGTQRNQDGVTKSGTSWGGPEGRHHLYLAVSAKSPGLAQPAQRLGLQRLRCGLPGSVLLLCKAGAERDACWAGGEAPRLPEFNWKMLSLAFYCKLFTEGER